MKNKIFIVALIGICTLMHGCRNAEEKKEMSPEAVVETFYRAVAAGDFEQACALCDSVGMQDYIEAYREAWADMQKKDSSALAIAGSILSEAEIKIEKVTKEGDGRTISYSIRTEDNTKKKVATVTKEEGAWRVESITDAI